MFAQEKSSRTFGIPATDLNLAQLCHYYYCSVILGKCAKNNPLYDLRPIQNVSKHTSLFVVPILG